MLNVSQSQIPHSVSPSAFFPAGRVTPGALIAVVVSSLWLDGIGAQRQRYTGSFSLDVRCSMFLLLAFSLSLHADNPQSAIPFLVYDFLSPPGFSGCLQVNMINTEAMHAAQQNDAGLVAESLAGNHDAFRQIVERYQTLICSLAYCATGSVSQSEDLAQETFVIAWKDLAALREPAKLRSWLCAIVRFRISHQFRRQGWEPEIGRAHV